MKEVQLWSFVQEKLSPGEKLILIIVADSNLSSPGKAGFKLVVTQKGELFGTIGGGIMEYNMIRECEEMFRNGVSEIQRKKLYHSKTSEGIASGLQCGGSQTLLFIPMNSMHLSLAKNITTAAHGMVTGVLTVTESDITFSMGELFCKHPEYLESSEHGFTYREANGVPDLAWVIGGGHVGLAVSRQMAQLGFYVVTIDPRESLFTMQQNTYAQKKLTIPYDKIGEYVPGYCRSYAVIVTADRDTDAIALKEIICKNFRYIGMMGSKKKIQSIFKQLIDAGINEDLLKKVHAPIGMEIAAETPDEIAVSIAAEIISVRNQREE